MKRQLLAFAAVLLIPAAAMAHSPNAAASRVEPFALSSVRVSSPAIVRVQRLAMSYLLGLDADRLVAPYLKEAGLPVAADNYPNWESMGLDGHIGGHYVSALAYMYAATGDNRIRERLTYTLDRLAEAQQASADGYLCGVPGGREIWRQVAEGNIRAGAFDLNGGWVPLYNIHKIMGGLRDAYTVGGMPQAKEMFLKLCRWFMDCCAGLSDARLQDMLRSEHGGLNEIFADAAQMASDSHYLSFARRLTQTSLLQPLMEHRDILTGMHANTQIPKVIGIAKIAEAAADGAWYDAADYFWHNVTECRSVSIGGNSVREHFHPIDNFDPMIESEQGPETCNTYNMLRLTKMLFLRNPDAAYTDYYERAMLNHILSSISAVQGGFVYFTPMRPCHYRVYSQPQTSFWCCVGSGLENHSRYGEMIYAHRAASELYVNTFLASTLQWDDNGVSVSISGDFPWDDKCRIIVKARKAGRWTLKIRRPRWTEAMSVSIDGKSVAEPASDGYYTISRTWKGETVVDVTMPMKVEAIAMPDHRGYYSFACGPMILAADHGTDGQTGLYADDSRGGHIAAGPKVPLHEAPVIVADTADLASLLHSDDSGNVWTVSALQPQAKYAGLKLMPFVNLSEHRYQIYFKVIAPDLYAAQMRQMEEREALRRQVEEKSVDVVYCGEQQPETDHQFRSEDSEAGVDADNRRWRQTRRWFAYIMKTGGARQLIVSCLCQPGSRARVLCNGRVVGAIDDADDAPHDITFGIDAADASTAEIKIEAVDGNSPKVFQIRTSR